MKAPLMSGMHRLFVDSERASMLLWESHSVWFLGVIVGELSVAIEGRLTEGGCGK